MSQDDESPTTVASGPARSRRFWLIAGAALVAVVAAGTTLAILFGPVQQQAAPGGPSGTGGTTPGTSASPEPEPDPEASEPPSGGVIDPDFGEPVADSVGQDDVADFGDDVTARLVAVTPYTATASQAGEVSGPAVLVEVELRNDTGAAISLDAVTVNCFYGGDLNPASPVTSDPSVDPFVGSLETGATARATYVFSVPEDETVTITVSKDATSPLVVFR